MSHHGHTNHDNEASAPDPAQAYATTSTAATGAKRHSTSEKGATPRQNQMVTHHPHQHGATIPQPSCHTTQAGHCSTTSRSLTHTAQPGSKLYHSSRLPPRAPPRPPPGWQPQATAQWDRPSGRLSDYPSRWCRIPAPAGSSHRCSKAKLCALPVPEMSSSSPRHQASLPLTQPRPASVV